MGARAVLVQSLGRVAMLLLWALAFWGALLLSSAAVDAWSEGSAAFARLIPGPGANGWSWLAALSVLLALGAGLVGALTGRSRGVWGVRSTPQNKKSQKQP